MRRSRPRPSDLVATGLWLLAGGFLVVASIGGPEGDCTRANHDAYVAASERVGLWIFGSALAMAERRRSSPPVRSAEVAGDRGSSARSSHSVPLGAACLFGFFALLELVGFGCLE